MAMLPQQMSPGALGIEGPKDQVMVESENFSEVVVVAVDPAWSLPPV